MKIVGLDTWPPAESEISKTVASKRERRIGDSFVILWRGHVKNAFGSLGAAIQNALGNDCFQTQSNLHSTILSRTLDPTEGVPAQRWRDDDLAISGELVTAYKDELPLTLEAIVFAGGGTVQLVYRNEAWLPSVRAKIQALGATVKPGTVDGDRNYTCTVVLGYLKKRPEHFRSDEIEKLINGCDAVAHVNGGTISLVQYRDLALNDIKTYDFSACEWK